ncbi:hypothetical protein HPB51_029381 [Rhipicephalus microplus]|uniref:Uncharacterized protein n=1 Tax=Rhipicephalus microplus TaxID=6941 RepID=A0A9J6CUC8_RHIMP|nr:hypothetical protein HPB51_029381 [Rhipicephalus microplus]
MIPAKAVQYNPTSQFKGTGFHFVQVGPTKTKSSRTGTRQQSGVRATGPICFAARRQLSPYSWGVRFRRAPVLPSFVNAPVSAIDSGHYTGIYYYASIEMRPPLPGFEPAPFGSAYEPPHQTVGDVIVETWLSASRAASTLELALTGERFRSSEQSNERRGQRGPASMGPRHRWALAVIEEAEQRWTAVGERKTTSFMSVAARVLHTGDE